MDRAVFAVVVLALWVASQAQAWAGDRPEDEYPLNTPCLESESIMASVRPAPRDARQSAGMSGPARAGAAPATPNRAARVARPKGWNWFGVTAP